jgi:hypothetical protein
VTEFEGDNGKTQQALIDAQLEVARIQAELVAVQHRLQALEQAGSAKDKFNGAVNKVEGQFIKIVELLTRKIQTEILTQWYGHAVSLQAISSDRKRDLGLHKRIQDLRRFIHVSTFDAKATVEQVNKRADAIGNKLLDLKAHIASEQAKS